MSFYSRKFDFYSMTVEEFYDPRLSHDQSGFRKNRGHEGKSFPQRNPFGQTKITG